MKLKKIAIALACLLMLVGVDACKKCDDATNPSCSNYNSCASASKKKLHVPFELRYKEEVCFVDSSLGLLNATIKFDSIDDYRDSGSGCSSSLGGYADVYLTVHNNGVRLPDIVFGPHGCLGESEYNPLYVFQQIGRAKLCFAKLSPSSGSGSNVKLPPVSKDEYSIKILIR